MAAELRRVAEETGDPELELEGAGWTVVDLLELGDIAGRRHPDRRRLASSPRRCTGRSGCGGRRCSAARARSSRASSTRPSGSPQETLAIGQRGQAENALHYYAQAMFNIRREQGRLGEVEDAVRGFIELYPAIPAWRAALALLLVELGRPGFAETKSTARCNAGRAPAHPSPMRGALCTLLLNPICAMRRLPTSGHT